MFQAKYAIIFVAALITASVISGGASAQSGRIVAIFDKNSTLVTLGDTETAILRVKNLMDENRTYDIYIGSTDDAFRNFIWFDSHKYDQYRVKQEITLGGHEEREIVIKVLGGKVGSYKLLVGPDGSDINNVYSSTVILVADRRNSGIFSTTPDLGNTWLLIVPLAAIAIVLLIGKDINTQQGRW